MNPYAPGPQWAPPSTLQRPPGRGRGVFKAVVVVLVVVLVAAAGFLVNRLLVSKVGGATSAAGSVERLVDALEDKDWTALGVALPPDETYQLAGLFRDSGALQEKLGGTPDSLDDQFDGVRIDVSDLSLSTDDIGTDLTKVSIERATILIEIDQKTTESLAALIPDVDPAEVGKLTVKVSVDGPRISYEVSSGSDGDSGTETVVVGGEEQPPFVMSVKRDGGWFVSPMFTAAQYAAEDAGWETADTSGSDVTFDSPEEAVTGFAEALAETFESSDVTHLADAMGGVEARLLRTYAPGINDELGSEPDFSLGPGTRVTVRDTEYHVTPGENGQARITIDTIGLTIRSEGRRADIDFDGDCVSVVEDGRSGDDTCLSDSGEFATRLYGAFGHLVAVPADGGWKVSPVATYFDWIGILQHEIAGLDTDLLKALVEMDFSGVVARTSDGEIGVGDEVTVDIAPVSQAIHVGVGVIDPEPSPALIDYSCSGQSPPHLCEVVVIDGDGELQDKDSRYDPDTGYEYGYEVTDGTRLLIVAVAGTVTVESEIS